MASGTSPRSHLQRIDSAYSEDDDFRFPCDDDRLRLDRLRCYGECAGSVGSRSGAHPGCRCSRSIDRDEHRLQREGYVAAFRHPDLLRAINSGPLGRIAVVYFEWAGPRHQSVAVPWTIVGNGAEAEAFADALASQPILPEAGTSISASLLFAERIFAVSGTRGQRRAIDITGDGANNDGPPVEPVRQRLIAKGVTINGLPIDLALDEAGEVTDYYSRYVVGAPRAFAITVDDKTRFADSIRRKLVLEIAWLPTPPVPVSIVSAAWQ